MKLFVKTCFIGFSAGSVFPGESWDVHAGLRTLLVSCLLSVTLEVWSLYLLVSSSTDTPVLSTVFTLIHEFSMCSVCQKQTLHVFQACGPAQHVLFCSRAIINTWTITHSELVLFYDLKEKTDRRRRRFTPGLLSLTKSKILKTYLVKSAWNGRCKCLLFFSLQSEWNGFLNKKKIM